MNQIADILDLATRALQQNTDAVLATVVRTEGSAYRHAGAMMLICEDGCSVGMISGGCLEPHIIKRAFWLTRHGANVQVYQTGDDIEYSENSDAVSTVVEDLAIRQEDENEFLDGNLNGDSYSDSYSEMDSELNFGLGCNGRVHVLFERLTTATPLLDLIRKVRNTQESATIATLVKFDSSQPQSSGVCVGTRINVDAYLKTGQLIAIDTNQVFSDVSTTLMNAANQLSEHTFHKKNAEYVMLESDLENSPIDGVKHKTERTEWLIQRICPQIRLLICGAGNDVMPLVTMAKLQDWHVTVIDSRPQYATRLRFPQADTVLRLSLEDTGTLMKLSNNAAVAVMSHSLTQDRARLAVLLEHSVQCNYKYIGQLGPRYRTERLIKEIGATMANPAVLAQGISQLHYPIGYKLGGDGPEALALSIMAQMSAVIHDQSPPVAIIKSSSNSQVSAQQTSTQTSTQSLTEHAYLDGYAKDYAHD